MKAKYFSSLLLFAALNPLLAKDPVDYVNPFIGTGGHGHTYPGASAPFGMVQLSPDTRLTGWDGCSAYHASDSVIYGFSHTHLNGTGCSDYGDVLLMPFVGNPELKNDKYCSQFKKSNEKAEPGFYSVKLDKYGINVSLTATKRAGFHKYSFPKGKAAQVLIDLQHRDEVIDSYIIKKTGNVLIGYRASKAWANNQKVYFAIEFNKPFKNSKLALNDAFINADKSQGKNVKAIIDFGDLAGEALLVKVGISAVSEDNALLNLNSEIKDWNFDAVKKEAKQIWNKELSKITVEGGPEKNKTKFYTALYHCMINPNLYSDVDGSYRGRDDKIHKTENRDYYTVFSLWDTFRAEHPLFTIIDQKRTNDYINTFMLQYQQSGYIPVWELSANETGCMIGYNGVPVIVDAYVKGIRDYDAKLALEACKKSANADVLGLKEYKKYGYVLADIEHESVSKTLEYAYDDWCISQLAKSINQNEDYSVFTKRAQSYKNVFDSQTGFMRARVNGGWYTPFDPAEVNNNYTEANSWQYTFFVPQDVNGYIKLMGGADKFEAKLDGLFTAKPQLSGREQADITGLIGQYAHGNEPSHHIAYMYNYVGAPWKTQKVVRTIMEEMYLDDPDGLIGNEDCGQMSAWLVMSAMGLYSSCPGTDYYTIGTPLFEKATINLESGKKFTIKAPGASISKFYVQNLKLNGKEYTKSFIKHEDIMKGGEIEFDLGASPNKKFAQAEIDRPKTEITDNLIQIQPRINVEKKIFSVTTDVNIDGEPGSEFYYTLDGTEPTVKSNVYSVPFTLDKTTAIKVLGLKNGIESKVIKADVFKAIEGRAIKLRNSFDPQYTAGGPEALIDGVRGSVNYRLGGWQGYFGKNVDAMIDLGKEIQLHKLGAGFLQDMKSWIFYPTQIDIYVSKDGEKFEKVGEIINEKPVENYDVTVKTFVKQIDVSARYIKLVAHNLGKLPDWHISAGEKPWLFIDEIVIE